MTRTLFKNKWTRYGVPVMVIAALVAAAILGPLAANVRADEPTFTVEPLGPLAVFPDDLSATIKYKLTNDPRQRVIHLKDFENVLMTRISFDDQAIVPWHTHPGPVIVTVAEGSLTITNAFDCEPRVYESGEGFVDPGQGNVHMAQADGETVVYARFFGIPDGGAPTTFVDNPGC